MTALPVSVLREQQQQVKLDILHPAQNQCCIHVDKFPLATIGSGSGLSQECGMCFQRRVWHQGWGEVLCQGRHCLWVLQLLFVQQVGDCRQRPEGGGASSGPCCQMTVPHIAPILGEQL